MGTSARHGRSTGRAKRPAAAPAWRSAGAAVQSAPPARCRGDQWYLLRGQTSDGCEAGGADVLIRYLAGTQVIGERGLRLHRPADSPPGGDLLAWLQAPSQATHLQVGMPAGARGDRLAEVVLHPVAERDPKCHPLAAVPRWSPYRPPFSIERILLPPSLASLAEHLAGEQVEVYEPTSKADLAGRAVRAACVLAPQWVDRLGIDWAAVEGLAASAWLVVDLETAWRLLRLAGRVATDLVVQSALHGIMSARVRYADVPTRGFALEDVFPYAILEPDSGFAVRVLQAGRAWKRYADEQGLATLLSSDTPDPRHCGDVLSAVQAVGGGELILTDLPWLVAGRHGSLLAPSLARHALRMHLGAALDDCVQYWNRWDDREIVVRDIADLPRRFEPLRTARWASPDVGLVRLGLALPAAEEPGAARTVLIRSGRVDDLAIHAGLPPEPLIIFMKMLAREQRERTAWAARYLRRVNVVWQFDSAAGRRYAASYASAAPLMAREVQTVVLARHPAADGGPAGAGVEIFADDEGLFGDRSLAWQAGLDARLRGLIERGSA